MLLPTPAARDWKSGQSNIMDRNARPLNEVVVNLLPTPRATDGTKGGPNQRGSSGDLMLPSAVMSIGDSTAPRSIAGNTPPVDLLQLLQSQEAEDETA
jgi:DNA (cytosine-5)-methyltransferase 1